LYFGSIKFFKHLIVIALALVLSALGLMVVFLSIENNSLREQIAAYENGGNPPASPTDSQNPDGTKDGDSSDNSGEITDEPTPEPPTPELVWPPLPSGNYGQLFPSLYAQVAPWEIRHTPEQANYVYFTFDDGPNHMTNSILNHLSNTGTHATFFVIPRESTASIMQKIRDEGHAIGVHSYSHSLGEIYASVEAFLEDFDKARNLIYEQTGILSDFFRFPGGSKNEYNEATRADIIAEMHRRGFVYFDWNVDSNDVRRASYDTMRREVRLDIAENHEAGNRSIVLFHDAADFTSWVVGDLIELIKASPTGYEFKTLCHNTRPHMW